MIPCPRCASIDVRRSQLQRADVWLLPLLLSPFRCRNCGSRFYDFFWRGAGLKPRRLLAKVENSVREVYHTQRARAAELMEPGPQPNRRIWVRHLVDWESALNSSTNPAERPFPARIKDVSCGGLRLIGHQVFENGSILSVEVPGLSRVMLAEVAHVNPQPDGSWSVGCRFTKELSEAELAAFLQRG